MLYLVVFIEECQALVSVNLYQEVAQQITSTEDTIELVIAKTDATIVLDRTSIIDLIKVSPHRGTETHVTRLASGVEHTPREVMSSQGFTSLSDGHHLTMSSGIMIEQHLIVSTGNDLSVFHNHRTERASMALLDATACFLDGHSHIIMMIHRQSMYD